MDNVVLRGVVGSIHFIRFPTSQMKRFLTLANQKGMAKLVTTVCATGGGAYKFEDDFNKVNKIPMCSLQNKLMVQFMISACKHELGEMRRI